MSTNTDGLLEFCIGCPAQKNFVGEITEDKLSIAVNGPESVGTDITYSYEPTSALNVHLELVDSTGGVSEKLHGLHMYRNNDKEKKRSKRQVTSAANMAGSVLVERIGTCHDAGVTNSGKRYCPAFNGDILNALLRQTLES